MYKENLITMLRRIEEESLDSFCGSVNCYGVPCGECPFNSVEDAQAAANELAQEEDE